MAAAGAALVQWPSTGGTNQQFEFVDAGDGYHRIKARHGGLVLQAMSNSTGADITQQSESGATSQQWRVQDHGDGTVSLINRASGLAMDVWERSTADGARVSQWTYHGSPTSASHAAASDHTRRAWIACGRPDGDVNIALRCPHRSDIHEIG